MQMNLRSKKGGIETRLLHMFSDQCTKLHFDKILFTDHLEIKPVHRGSISQFFVRSIHYSGYIASTGWKTGTYTNYGRPVRKSPSLHGRKSTPTPKILGTAEAYFVCHISPNFQISLAYAFIGCP